MSMVKEQIIILDFKKAETERTNCEGGEEADTLSKKKEPEKEGRILEKEIWTFCGSL